MPTNSIVIESDTKAAPRPEAPVDYVAKARAAYATREKKPEEPKAATAAPAPAAPEGRSAEPEKKVEPEKKEEPKAKPPSDTIAKSFEKLAAEREAHRKEVAEFKAQAQKYATLEAAIANKDPRALLSFAGMTHEDYVKAWTGAQPEEAQTEKPAAKGVDPEVAELKAQVKAMQEQLQQRQYSEAEQQVRGVLKTQFESMKSEFPLAAKFGDESISEALGVMTAHFNRTGQHLADDPVENLRAALAVVEEKHQATVKKYGLLTSAPEATTTKVAEATEAPRVASVALTNGDESGPPGKRATPLTAEEYRAMALATLKRHTPAR